ncbi:MAG TPA: endonuclease/exonuclease/phosphatase family protein [Kofleriaceae bacterium]|nr:endonuclease/exonuclease/phosphatase family protein [Kofleriaceae bacterium]
MRRPHRPAMIEGVLRVMSYNIHSGRGGDDHVDLGRIAAVIESFAPDLVALQECGHGAGGTPEQAEELGRRLSMEPRFVPCLDRKNTRYGLATLSRLPIVETEVARLPHRGRVWWSEPRRALVTRVAWNGRQVQLVNTHLSTIRGEQPSQVMALGEVLAAPDLVLAGDFNCTPRSKTYRRLCDPLDAALARARTWPALMPIFHFDHIFFRGALRVAASSTWLGGPARIASDHLPVVAAFEESISAGLAAPARAPAAAQAASGS